MALQKRKISQLPPAGPITGSELVEVVQGGQNRRALASQFSGGGGGGPVAWGGIIGNIDTQSDLIARFSQYTMNTDPRLSDAREWTAETVTQAEAEAGISSTRRAWSAHRVRQSIEFFWESATTPFGRVLLQTPSASTARGSLELGDSATRNVGTTAGTVAAGDDPRFGGGGGATSWGSILGDIEDQTDLTSALASKVDDGDPRLSDARTPTAHTHPISDVVGLQGELDGKEFALTAGANITIDRTNPAAPVISSSGGGGGGGADWGQIGGILSDQTDLQNALNAKANDNDPRLSDAREWTAETVSEAEAEAGTATARRAWTAQRVRQAIESWWQGASSAFGRVLVGSADAASARSALGLGDASTRNVGSAAGSVAAGDDPRLSDARPPTAHTHPISDVIGLQGELDDKASALDLAGKENTLVAGTNITIDRTNPAAPVISSSGGGGGGADWGQIGGDLSDQTDLMAALNGKASLAGGNAFTGLQSFQRIRETVAPVTGTTPALGAGDATIFTWTLSANSTPTSGLADGESCTVLITPGAFSINWTNFSLSEAGAPELSSGKVTTVVLWRVGTQTFVDFVRQHDA